MAFVEGEENLSGSVCSDHGTCTVASGHAHCACEDPWVGADCALQAGFDDTSNDKGKERLLTGSSFIAAVAGLLLVAVTTFSLTRWFFCRSKDRLELHPPLEADGGSLMELIESKRLLGWGPIGSGDGRKAATRPGLDMESYDDIGSGVF